jgi:hypothetical protein
MWDLFPYFVRFSVSPFVDETTRFFAFLLSKMTQNLSTPLMKVKETFAATFVTLWAPTLFVKNAGFFHVSRSEGRHACCWELVSSLFACSRLDVSISIYLTQHVQTHLLVC